MNNLKVALIIERANIILGGAERSVFELSSALGSVGLDVDILAAKGETDAKNIRLLCTDNPASRTGYFQFKKALKKHLHKNKYDIVHSVLPFKFADVYQPRGGCYAEAALRNAHSYRNPMIVNYKRLTSFANLNRTLYLMAEKYTCLKSEKTVVAALSDYVSGQFQRHYKLSTSRIVTIPNGINTNKKPNPQEADILRAKILSKLNLTEPDEPALFFFAANNYRLKGLKPLMKAFSRVVKQNTERPPFLIIAGSGQKPAYKSLARLLNIHDRTLFLGQIRNIQNALSITDTAVLPTYYDPASRFILEALAVGNPVITTAFNGATDLFEHGRHGLVIDSPENITALEEALTFYCSSDNIQDARKYIEQDRLTEKISILRVAQDLKKLYISILENRKT